MLSCGLSFRKNKKHKTRKCWLVKDESCCGWKHSINVLNVKVHFARAIEISTLASDKRQQSRKTEQTKKHFVWWSSFLWPEEKFKFSIFGFKQQKFLFCVRSDAAWNLWAKLVVLRRAAAHHEGREMHRIFRINLPAAFVLLYVVILLMTTPPCRPHPNLNRYAPRFSRFLSTTFSSAGVLFSRQTWSSARCQPVTIPVAQ